MIINSLHSLYISMEEVHQAEATLEEQYTPDLKLLLCPLCQEVFTRPITLSCGHSFCHQCLIASISRKMSENVGNRAMGMIPICPSCHSIIWRYCSAYSALSPHSRKTSHCPHSWPGSPPKTRKRVVRSCWLHSARYSSIS